MSSFVSLVSTEKIEGQQKQEILDQIPPQINPFSLYSPKPNRQIFIDFNSLEIIPELCSPKDANQVFGLVEEENGFKLLAKNGNACARIELGKIITEGLLKNSLVKVNFESGNNNEQKAYVCLFDKRLDRCKGQPFPESYFLIKDNIENYQLQFNLDNIGQKDQKELVYKNISLNIYNLPLLSLAKISAINEETFFKVAEFNRKPEPCSQPQANQLEGNILKEEDKTFIRYLSQGGSACDHFAYPTLDHKLGYAIVAESRNIDGLPLKLCLTNYETERCDLYVELSDKDYFGKQVFLIPPMGDGIGYDINLNNHSIGNSHSINDLASIIIYPIDYQWFEFGENNQNNNLVILNQSFEKNWRAFNWEKPLKIKSLGEPILINNWQNGWHNPEGEEIHFFFLPQALEYLGFFLILVLIVLIAVF